MPGTRVGAGEPRRRSTRREPRKIPDVEASAQVWRDFKAWLTENSFAFKCAYCEGPLDAQTSGAAEHWRPKRGVEEVDASGKALKVVDAENIPHRGYWWLAFAWENLVPACSRCNEKKGVKFPITGDRVFSPDDIGDVKELDGRERPLLLHPYRGDDPANHIEFDSDGFAIAKTVQGQTTIDVCGLNRRGLCIARAKAQHDSLNALATACTLRLLGSGVGLEHEMARWDSAGATYSRAICDYLRNLANPVAEELVEHAQRRWGRA